MLDFFTFSLTPFFYAPYHALAEIKAEEDLLKYHTKRSKDEFILEDLAELMKLKRTQRLWDKIVTLDPKGLDATRPTISATTANMRIAELENVVEPG